MTAHELWIGLVAQLLAGSTGAASGLVLEIVHTRFSVRRGLLPPYPPGESDGSERDGSALRPSSCGGLVRSGADQFTIHLRRLARCRRSLTLESIGPWNPAADVRERFRTADGTTLLVVNLLAVETQARKAKLYPLMINPQCAALHTSDVGGFLSLYQTQTRNREFRPLANGNKRSRSKHAGTDGHGQQHLSQTKSQHNSLRATWATKDRVNE